MNPPKKKIKKEPKQYALFAKRFIECIPQRFHQELLSNFDEFLNCKKQSNMHCRDDDTLSADALVNMCKYLRQNKTFTVPCHITLEEEMWSEFIVLCEKFPNLSGQMYSANILILDKNVIPYILYKKIANAEHVNELKINKKNEQHYDIRKSYGDAISYVKNGGELCIEYMDFFIYKYATLFLDDCLAPHCYYHSGNTMFSVFSDSSYGLPGVFNRSCLPDQFKMFANIYNTMFTKTLNINIDHLTEDKVKEISDDIKKCNNFSKLLQIFELVMKNRNKYLDVSKEMTNLCIKNIHNEINLLKDIKQLTQKRLEQDNYSFINDIIEKLTQEVFYEKSINDMSQHDIDQIVCKLWQIIPIYGRKMSLLARDDETFKGCYKTLLVKYFFHVVDRKRFNSLIKYINKYTNERRVTFYNSDTDNIYMTIRKLLRTNGAEDDDVKLIPNTHFIRRTKRKKDKTIIENDEIENDRPTIENHKIAKVYCESDKIDIENDKPTIEKITIKNDKIATKNDNIAIKNDNITITVIDLDNIGPTELMFYALCVLCTWCYDVLAGYRDTLRICYDEGVCKCANSFVSYIRYLTLAMMQIAECQTKPDLQTLKDGRINFVDISRDLYKKIVNVLAQLPQFPKDTDIYKFLERQLQRLANNFEQNESIDNAQIFNNVQHSIDDVHHFNNTQQNVSGVQAQQMIADEVELTYCEKNI